jgi:small-conductance mechanosensitive channel
LAININFETFIQFIRTNEVDILFAVAVATAIVFALLGVKAIILRIIRRMDQEHVWPALIADGVRRTRLWFLIALAARLVQGYTRMPPDVAEAIAFIFIVAAVVQSAIWVRAFIVGFVEHRAAESFHDEHNLKSAVSLIRLLVTAVVFAIAAIFVLDNLGVNVTGLVAGLGIGGIAIGLAAQGIISDLFAALSIIFDKPFRVGDTISYNGKEGIVTGTVEKIGLKSTRIRSLTGELRIIGNAQLLAQEVTNFSGREVFRLHLPVGVIYQTPPDVARSIPDIMRELVESSGNRFVRASFTGFGPSSIDFELYFEADVDNIVDAQLAYQEVALKLFAVFNERGIDFAYPTQTTFTAAPDGRMVMPYPDISVLKAG